ncbi:MAG: hypothetical protein KDE48_09850 [Anaerolineales bacterium]|nr:hypothetical protein [Anaerolineales bacterium]
MMGDTVTAVAEIAEVHASGWVWLHCTITNNADQVVLRGKVRGYPGRFAA